MNERNKKEEIDIIDLIIIIWKQKVWLLISVCFFCTLAVLYTKITPQKWVSKTHIMAPSVKNMGDYLSVYKQYNSIINKKIPDDVIYDAIDETSSFLFEGFIDASDSYQYLLGFFKHRYPQGGDNSLKKLLSSLKVEKPSKQKDSGYLIIQVEESSAKTAYSQLRQFIDYIDNVTQSNAISDLVEEINIEIVFLKKELEKKQIFHENIRSARLQNLAAAFLTAKKAEIKQYSKEVNDRFLITNSVGEAGIILEDDNMAENNFLFLLGQDYLEAQINTLKESEIVYPEEYYAIKTQVKLLEQLRLKLDGSKNYDFSTFSYQSEPNMPLKPSQGSVIKFILIGIFLGIVFGVLAILLKVALENKRVLEHA